MKLIFLVCGILGIMRGFAEMKATEKGYIQGVRPSNSLIEFIFLNR